MTARGRPRHQQPVHRAGLLLLAWARSETEAGRPGALERLAESCGVDVRTVQRWIVGSREPTARAAVVVLHSAGVPVEAWGEMIEAG